MKLWQIMTVSMAALATSLAAEPERWFRVAPAPIGNDANDGSASAPFASLDRARRAVREHLAAHEQRGEIVVELAGGSYRLAEAVRFDAADSGRNGFPVIYRAVAGAEVILSGGRPVKGWRPESDGTYRAEVGKGVDFRQLWVDGRRAVRARTPNAGQMLRLGSEKKADGFDLPRELLRNVTLRPGEVEISVAIAWMHKRLRIARLDLAENPEEARVVIEAVEWDAVTRQPQGDRIYLNRPYWLENAPEFLDAPGEFYLDRGAGQLCYRPREGEDLQHAGVVRPELENLVILEGKLEAPVRNLRFEGLTFAHTGWTRPNRSGFVDVQANSLVPADTTGAVDKQYRHDQKKDRVPAAFQAFTADNVVIRGCRFIHLGGTGVMFLHGGNDNVIEGNTFYDLAAGGIEVGEDAARPEDARLFPRRTRIANNFIAHVGEDYFGSVPILGYYTDSSEIAHNEIANVPYTAISQGWGWGNPPAPDDSRGNRILHNHVSNYMRRLDDGGGIYTTDRLLGSEIAYNQVDRMVPPDARTKSGGALYLDQFSEGVHVHDNVVTEAIRWLFIWNPNIRHNRVETNFSDTTALRNDGKDNVVEPVRLLGDASADNAVKVKAIRDQAGIEPAWADRVRRFTSNDMVIVENTGTDFHEGEGWETATVAGSRSATVKTATLPEAVAHWWPVLPKSGYYEVEAWLPPASAKAVYTIAHTGGRTEIAPDVPTVSSGGWIYLGEFRFRSGIGAEVRQTRAKDDAGRPLVADALRFRWVDE